MLIDTALLLQSEINDKCGCNAIEYPYLNKSLPFCLALDTFLHEDGCRGGNLSNSSIVHDRPNNWKPPHGVRRNDSCLEQLEKVKHHVWCKSGVTKHYQVSFVVKYNDHFELVRKNGSLKKLFLFIKVFIFCFLSYPLALDQVKKTSY